MKTVLSHTLMIVVGLGGLAREVIAQGADILPAAQRETVVEQANLLIDPPPKAELLPEINSPFFPNSLKPREAAALDPVLDFAVPVQAAPSSVYDLLGKIAPQINPTGAITLGGEPLLMFGQTRIKIGDQLPIFYDGERYTLVITRIESSNFTLRLGAAEVTRPINSN